MILEINHLYFINSILYHDNYNNFLQMNHYLYYYLNKMDVKIKINNTLLLINDHYKSIYLYFH